MIFSRKVFLAIFLFITGLASAQTVTVIGNLSNVLGTAQPDAFLRIRLRNFSGNVPRVINTGALVVTQEDIKPDATGFISTAVYGNDEISPANTYYTLEFWQNGRMQSSQNFLIFQANPPPFNFNTAIPITTVPGPPPFLPVLQNPTTNQSVNGNFSLTFNGPLFFKSETNFANVTFANLNNVLINNGDMAYCQDCQQTNPCVSGGSGAFAQQVSGSAQCSSGSGGGGSAFAVVTNPVANITNLIQPTAATVTPITLQCPSGAAPTLLAESIINSSGGNVWNVTCGGNMTVGDGVSGTVSGAAVYGALKSVAFSATPSFDLGAADVFQMTLTGNVTSSSLLNMPSSNFGDVITFVLCQDGVGGRSFVWPPAMVNPPTVVSTANACTIQGFVTNGVSAYAIGAAGGGSGISGLTTNFIPKASSGVAIQNSSMSETGNPPVIGAPRIEQIRYVDQFNWAQSIASTLTGGSPATVTLSPCPFGVYGTDNTSYLYISSGTPEIVQLTGGGSCTGGAGSGTVTFTPLNNHTNPYTIGSASSGFQEALNDAGFGTPNGRVVLSPTPGSSNAFVIRGAVTPRINNSYIDGAGAVLDCETRDKCINVSATWQVREIANIRFATNLQFVGSAITNTACATNASTITANNTFVVGDWVDVQNTFNPHYWGIHQVATVSPTQFTYTDTNCGGLTTIASALSAGGVALEQAKIEANNQGLTVRNVMFDTPGGFTGWFNNGIVVDNDQGFTLENTYSSGQGHCTAAYCSNQVYAPGPFGNNAAVIYLLKDNISLNCTSNGVRNYGGNTLSVRDSVIQGYPEFGVETGTLRGGFGPSKLDNTYMEIGSCTNPMYPGSTKSQVGLLANGNTVSVTAGEGPQGQFPQFITQGSGGATTKQYWIIAHDSVSGYSRPINIGFATPTTGGNLTVYWPRVQGTNTITYDLLETTGSGIGLQAPFGTGNYLVSGGSGLSQAAVGCDVSNICSFNDSQAALTSYTVQNAGYTPVLWFWPGAIVLSNQGDQAASSTAYVDRYIGQVVAPQAAGGNSSAMNYASVYAKECSPGQLASPIAVVCQNQDPSTAGNTSEAGALMLRYGVVGGSTGGLKGLINFYAPTNNNIPATHFITIGDCNADKTLATYGNRPTNDACDTAIGIDNTSGAAPSTFGLSISAPTTISEYINNVGDGTSWKTRLSSTSYLATVPFSAPTATNLYVIDGLTYSSICTVAGTTVPSNTSAIIYSLVLETNINCDPFNLGRNIELHLGRFTSPYTINVPWRIGPNEKLIGSGRGFAGGGATKGTTIQPSASYAGATTNPFVSTTPSGFTISASATNDAGCGGTFPTPGTYEVEVSWGPDTSRETQPAQETAVTLAANQCFKIVPPVSPPTNVTTYDIYIGNQGLPSGSEHWVAQAAIGTTKFFTFTGTTVPAGSGQPVAQNNTGAIIVVGNANGPQGNVTSTQATFGSRVEQLSIDCNNVAGCVGIANLTGEEGSLIDNVDTQNTPGVAGIIVEGYGNIGTAASNSRISNVTVNAGNTSNPTVAGVFIDAMTSWRGIDGITVTTTASPICIDVHGSLNAPQGGTQIANAHMEKCTSGIQAENGAHVVAINATCSPTNVTQCTNVADANSSITDLVIRGGTSDFPVQDCSFTPCYQDTKGYIDLYTTSFVGYISQLVGSAPTCSALPVNPGPNLTGTTGTCLMDLGSNNNTGTMLLTANGGSELTAGTVQLTFAGTGLGQNGASCTFEPISGGTAWPDNTTHRVTAIGTGNAQVRFIPGGGAGTAFANGNTFKISYHCDGY